MQRIRALPVPNDAIAWALRDVLTVPYSERQYMRYIWSQDLAVWQALDEKERKKVDPVPLKVISLTANYISRASFPLLAPMVPGGLVRMDLRQYAPRDADLAEWLKLWEEFAFDPTFSLLITRDTVGEVKDLPRQKVRRQVTRKVPNPEFKWRTETRDIKHPGGRYVWPDDSGKSRDDVPAGEYSVDLRFRVGEEFLERIEFVEEERDAFTTGVDVVRFNGRDIDPAAFVSLQTQTQSLAPVVEWRYFLHRSLTTVKDKGVYAQVFGGLYYDLRGIRKSKDKKATDEDVFFESLGVGNIKAGESAASVFDRLRSDQRLAVFRSGVTGKPRRVDMFHTLAGREGTGWGSITHDIKDQDVDIGTHPVMNLLEFKDAAREAIFEGPNGMPLFALFNGAGARQDEVPPDVAVDRTIPTPHTMRLQPAIGCIRCHGTEEGWKPLTNDVKRLTGGRLDIFDDVSNRKHSRSDVLDRLTGLYAGNFDKHLMRARDDYAETLLHVTGPWKESEKGQTDTPGISARRISETFSGYNYTMVDAQSALRELGIDCPKDRAQSVYNLVLPPDLRAFNGEFAVEDVRLAAPGRGVSVNRSDWSLVRSFAAERSVRNRQALLKREAP